MVGAGGWTGVGLAGGAAVGGRGVPLLVGPGGGWGGGGAIVDMLKHCVTSLELEEEKVVYVDYTPVSLQVHS